MSTPKLGAIQKPVTLGSKRSPGGAGLLLSLTVDGRPVAKHRMETPPSCVIFVGLLLADGGVVCCSRFESFLHFKHSNSAFPIGANDAIKEIYDAVARGKRRMAYIKEPYITEE